MLNGTVVLRMYSKTVVGRENSSVAVDRVPQNAFGFRS